MAISRDRGLLLFVPAQHLLSDQEQGGVARFLIRIAPGLRCDFQRHTTNIWLLSNRKNGEHTNRFALGLKLHSRTGQ